MLKQKLHHFCNRSFPDDGLKSAESTRDTYNYGQYINQSPPQYDKSNTGIRTDPEENM